MAKDGFELIKDGIYAESKDLANHTKKEERIRSPFLSYQNIHPELVQQCQRYPYLPSNIVTASERIALALYLLLYQCKLRLYAYFFQTLHYPPYLIITLYQMGRIITRKEVIYYT